MKYPIDALSTETFFGHLISHDRAQRQMIQALTLLLQESMQEPGAKETDWYKEAKGMIELQGKIKADHENRIFNAKNGHPDKTIIELQTPSPTGDVYEQTAVSVPGAEISAEMSAKMSELEKGFGEELSEEELAGMFSERPKKQRPGTVDLNAKEPFKGMSLDEIESWEASQNNNNDIYKVKARISNLAVSISGGNLTPVGTMMVNSFVHVIKDLYDFADVLTDKELRIRLTERIRKHENMPGTLIAAASAGVKVGKK